MGSLFGVADKLFGVSETLFGDQGKAQSRAVAKENEANRDFIREATAAAREDISRIFPQAQAARLFGAQGAQSIMQGFVPQQAQAFQQGNLQAQGTQAQAVDQIRNALLGLPTSSAFLQPQEQFQPNFDFLNQPLQAPQPQQVQAQPFGGQQLLQGINGIGNEAGQNPFNLQFLQNRINPFGGGF